MTRKAGIKSEGWLKSWRHLWDHKELRGSAPARNLLCFLIHQAEYEPTVRTVKTARTERDYPLIPGQLLTSKAEIARETGIAEGSIGYVLRRFASTDGPHRIEVQPIHKKLLITLSHWPNFHSVATERKSKPLSEHYPVMTNSLSDNDFDKPLNGNGLETEPQNPYPKMNEKLSEHYLNPAAPNISKEGTEEVPSGTGPAKSSSPWSWEAVRDKWLPQLTRTGADYTLAEAREAWVRLNRATAPGGEWIVRQGLTATDPRAALEAEILFLRRIGPAPAGSAGGPKNGRGSNVGNRITLEKAAQSIAQQLADHPGNPRSCYGEPTQEEIRGFQALEAKLADIRKKLAEIGGGG